MRKNQFGRENIHARDGMDEDASTGKIGSIFFSLGRGGQSFHFVLAWQLPSTSKLRASRTLQPVDAMPMMMYCAFSRTFAIE